MTTAVPAGKEQKLELENIRLHLALQALYDRTIVWLTNRHEGGDGRYRVGLYNLDSARGPHCVITVYNGSNPASRIHVADARDWAESIVNSPVEKPGEMLYELALDVLRYLGEHKL